MTSLIPMPTLLTDVATAINHGPETTIEQKPAMQNEEASTAADPVISHILGQLHPVSRAPRARRAPAARHAPRADSAPRPTPMEDDEAGDDALPMHGRKGEYGGSLKNVIGRRLIAAREMNGFTQSEAAAKIGYKTSAQLCLWESGSRLPPLHLASVISEVFGVSTDWLLGLDDSPERDSATAAKNAVVRRMGGLLEQHAKHIAGALFEVQRFDPTPLLRSSGLCGLVLELASAVERYRERNLAAFDDTACSALLVRIAGDARAAAETITKAMDRADFRMIHEMNKARKALNATPELPVAMRL